MKSEESEQFRNHPRFLS
jgi:hypothetical protein